MVLAYALAFGGSIQLLAGMLEFVKKNVFAATVFSSFGGFWIGLAIYNYLKAAGTFPEDASDPIPRGEALFFTVWR